MFLPSQVIIFNVSRGTYFYPVKLLFKLKLTGFFYLKCFYPVKFIFKCFTWNIEIIFF